MSTTKPDPRLQSILARGVSLIVAAATDAGYDRPRITRAVAEAFRAAVSAAVSGDGSLDPDATDTEGEAMALGMTDYPAIMMARVMWTSLAGSGLDLADLHQQERAWCAIQALCAAQIPPA